MQKVFRACIRIVPHRRGQAAAGSSKETAGGRKSKVTDMLGEARTNARPNNSVSSGHSVFPRFAGADINALAIVRFDFYGLITAVAADIETHIVPFLAQLAHAFVRNAAFTFDVAAVLHFFAGRFVVAFVVPAGGVAGLLHIQTKVNLVSEYLRVSLRLHVATHHA